MGIDFHTYFLNISNGIKIPMPENYLVMGSSLRSHRHRKGDMLVILLDFNQPTAVEIEPELKKAGKIFFETPGSVTNAIQTTAGAINSFLLDMNLAAETGESVNAAANFVVYHNGSVFMAQTGVTHTLVLEEDSIIHFNTLDMNERGLGASRRFYLNFKQTAIQAGHIIILTSAVPSIWDEKYLTGSTQLSMEMVKERLLNQANGDLSAIVIKCREGKGVVSEDSWIEGSAYPLTDQAKNSSSQSEIIQPQSSIMEDAQTEEEIPSRESPIEPYEDMPLFSPEREQQEPDDLSLKAGQTEKAHIPEENQHTPRLKKQNSTGRVLSRKWAGFINSIKQGIQEFFVRLDHRLSPETNTLENGASTNIMSFIVIAIPILLIVISALVYVYSGRREQHQAYLEEVQTYISMAATLEEPDQQRDYWSKAYETVLKAMDFGDSDLADSLLTQTQTIIDDMDLVTRLDFRPATTSQFGSNVVLTKIKSNESGVYLLDDNSGKVFHITKDSKGFYNVDANFQCDPGTYGVVSMGKIVDFTMLPTNTRGYELLAIDAGGNLLYCQPGESPDEGSIIPPNDEWGRIAAFSLDEYTLFVVDAESSRIWSYAGRDFEIAAMAGIVFSSHPVDYLGTEEVDLGGTLDLIVNKEDLFILHQDSHITTCQYNAYREGNAIECQDPNPFGDSRIGYEKNPLVYFDSKFRVIQETQYPNSAFYILDSAQQAILQFSYQLNLEKLIKPQPSKTYPLPDTEMSGLGVTNEKELFLAYGNQLYIADLP